MNLLLKRSLQAIPVAVGAAAYYTYSYKISNYPPEAKRHLRKALLAHDYNIGNIFAAQNEYSQAYTETIKVLPKNSREAVGILEKLADLYEELHKDKECEQTLSLLFANLTDPKIDETNTEEVSTRIKLLKSSINCAEKLAVININKEKLSDAAFYYRYILETSLLPNPSKDGKNIEPLILKPFANVTQVGSAFEQMGIIYTKRNMHNVAISVYMKALEMLYLDKTIPKQDFIRQSVIIHNNIANSFSVLKDYQNAQKYLQISIELSPINSTESVVARYNMASVMECTGMIDKAIQYYREALECGKKVGYDEGIAMCERELKRLEEINEKSNKLS